MNRDWKECKPPTKGWRVMGFSLPGGTWCYIVELLAAAITCTRPAQD